MSEHVAEVAYSHLYPGLLVDAPAGAGDFLVPFGDDSESRARLLRDAAGRPSLRVDGYTTARGTVIGERVWTVRASERRGDRVRLRLGQALS